MNISINIYTNVWLHNYASNLYRKQTLCSHLFEIFSVIALIIDYVKIQMNIDIKIISIYFMNHVL